VKTESNYYRIILETVWGYEKELLDTMTDEECEEEYSILPANC
jgi:hypothetical protein